MFVVSNKIVMNFFGYSEILWDCYESFFTCMHVHMFLICAVITAGFIHLICNSVYVCLCVSMYADSFLGPESWLISKPSLSICSELRAVWRQLSPNILSLSLISDCLYPSLACSLISASVFTLCLSPLLRLPACWRLLPVPVWTAFWLWNGDQYL